MGKSLAQIIVLAAAVVAAVPAVAGSLPIADGNSYFHVPTTNWKQSHLRTVIIQQYDFSCGSAALAALLTFHYHRPTSEQEVFQAMYKVGDQEQIRRVGFSLLDMKKYLEAIGAHADGFRVSLDTLAKLRIPAITLIEVKGYKHFVLIKGIEGNRVLLGDPARGVIAVPRPSFEAQWNGIAFVIRDDPETAQSSFNDARDWSTQGRAPVTTGVNEQSLASLTLNFR